MNRLPNIIAVVLVLAILVSLGGGTSGEPIGHQAPQWDITSTNLAVRKALDNEVPQTEANLDAFYVMSLDIKNNGIKDVQTDHDFEIDAAEDSSYLARKYDPSVGTVFRQDQVVPVGCTGHLEIMFTANRDLMEGNKVQLILGKYRDVPIYFEPMELPE